MNSGTCFLGQSEGSYFCLCSEGFVGVDCQEPTSKRYSLEILGAEASMVIMLLTFQKDRY